MLKFLFIFVLTPFISSWPNHPTTTLKLLQVIHRHGERTPISFANDPYKDEKYWTEGIGQLTVQGKYRLHNLGKFIRTEYKDYLGKSPREVYVRSSIEHRCIESVSALLSGAYPPGKITF